MRDLDHEQALDAGVGGAAGTVVGVSAGAAHGVDKPTRASIRLLAGLGVEGDAHCGATVQHRSRLARDPSQPNLRQVHVVHDELLDDLRAAGFDVGAGSLGENVTIRGVDVLSLPTRTRLRFGADAVIELTGLRNPCVQLDRLLPGLRRAVAERGSAAMAVVAAGGLVRPGDPVVVEVPGGAAVAGPLRPV